MTTAMVLDATVIGPGKVWHTTQRISLILHNIIRLTVVTYMCIYIYMCIFYFYFFSVCMFSHAYDSHNK
jgi:hypothetical protein